MGRIALHISLAAFILGLGFPVARAQEKPVQQQQKPATQKPKDTRIAQPAAPVQPLSKENQKGQAQTSEQSQSTSSKQDRKPLSGAEQFTLSTMGRGRSYFYPIFQVAESGDTNPENQIGSSTLESASTISGAFALNHVWSRYNFAANYAGSGFIYNQDPSLSTSAHSFTLSQTITGKRSTFTLADAVSYLPESSFGYDRFGGFGNFGIGGLFGVNSANLNGIYIPNQSILTGDSSRVSNSVVGEYDYSLSPLSSLTFVGSYGLLRFPDTNFIDSNAGIFGIGYNHSFSQRDTIAVTYMGNVFRYDQSSNNFNSHVVALIYGHRISQLLSLRLGAGPQVNMFGSAANNDTMTTWYATASLAYQLSRTALSFGYTHYTSGGAGVFQGAETDNLGMAIDRRITRMWSGGVSLGYSHNKNVLATSSSQAFNTWYGTANLRRPLGHYTDFFLSYNIQQQSSNDPFCIGSDCGSFYTRNYFSLGFNWHPRSVELGGIQ